LSLPVKDIGYKNQSGAEVITVDYDSVLTLQSLAATNAAKNTSDDALIAANFKKRMMLVCGEFTGVLVARTVSQFSYGSGSTSNNANDGYGLPVPFSFDLVRVLMIVDTTSTDLSATFNIVRYDFGNTVGFQLGSFVLDTTGGSNYIRWNTQSLDNIEGNICIECASFTGTSEPDAEFRISLALQCDTEFS